MLATELEKLLGFDLRKSWQVRLLEGTRDQLRAVALSVIAHNYVDQVPFVLTIAFPWYRGPDTPMPLPCLTSAAKVAKNGTIVADVIDRQGVKHRDKVIFNSDIHLRDAFRRVADKLKFPDDDRVELFRCLKTWVVADRRLDPNFDPRDPDAKRLH
jgi:hypothetical protein